MAETDDQSFSYDNIKPLSRIKARAVSLAFGNPLYGLTLVGKTPDELEVVPLDPWPGKADRGRLLLQGIQDFAGQVVESVHPQWEPFGATDAWMTEMHSFGWLRDLRTVGGDAARVKAREMVADWLENYHSWHEITWRPDILGRRIAAWISFYDFFCASAEDDLQAALFKSLTVQARHLSRVLPAGLEGLQLIDAIRGLAFSGLALDGGLARLDQALDMLEKYLPEQILPDGGHVSRNPHILALTLRHLIDLRAALLAAEEEVPETLEAGIRLMAPALRFFRHSDGGLALFNGAQEDEAVLLDAILNRSGVRGRLLKSASDSGFERMTHGRTLLIMDTGMPTNDAHAGTLGFEMSVGRDRLIVNCGSHPSEGQWRELLRCTAAHSTLTVDDMSSTSFKKDGTLGRKPEVQVERKDVRGACLVQASHDGYLPSHGLTHRRCLYLGEGGKQVVGEDTLTGRVGIPFAVRFHLHPTVKAAVVREGREALLSLPSGQGWRMDAQGGVMTLEESIYLGQGTQPRGTQQIVVGGVTSGGTTTLNWTLTREG